MYRHHSQTEHCNFIDVLGTLKYRIAEVSI